jgi:hypothetical protein
VAEIWVFAEFFGVWGQARAGPAAVDIVSELVFWYSMVMKRSFHVRAGHRSSPRAWPRAADSGQGLRHVEGSGTSRKSDLRLRGRR